MRAPAVERLGGRLPLRGRLALLTALAVTVAVAVCAVVAWFLVRDQLINSLDEQLRETQVNDGDIAAMVNAGRCTEEPEGPEDQPQGAPPVVSNYVIQVVFADGSHCVLPLSETTLDVTEADLEMTQQAQQAPVPGPRPHVLHDATGANGEEYRVMTSPLPGNNAAVSVARPLSEVDDPLSSLAVVLALVAAAGAVGAAGVGVMLARAGLRPVSRLIQTAEHIARTEDLSVRLPVHGSDTDEIARLSRSFNSMTAALASSRDLQQQLIADAGHELRTPLTSLRTNIELLTRSEETGRPLPAQDRAELLASVKEQLTELAALIGDLQELSRPEQAGGHPVVVGLHEVTERALRRAGLRARELRIDSDLEPWYVRAEPAALERAVVNLLDNAIKFSRVGGAEDSAVATKQQVEVVLRDGVLRIRDHGPGIDPEELPHVFERFWRSPGARALPGSGLGLSIVARTVRACGGDIALRPAEGGGTEAVLTLPGAPAPPAEPPTGAA
ncbi:HAMP domain-containing sensor histidine kinase [Streptomyces sp. B6B3]|uniref:sensor histidine kinase n=1 Tax=Streptomyces sp. B6B3 TaxID=3153570 RepID=UPI00325CB075